LKWVETRAGRSGRKNRANCLSGKEGIGGSEGRGSEILEARKSISGILRLEQGGEVQGKRRNSKNGKGRMGGAAGKSEACGSHGNGSMGGVVLNGKNSQTKTKVEDAKVEYLKVGLSTFSGAANERQKLAKSRSD